MVAEPTKQYEQQQVRRSGKWLQWLSAILILFVGVAFVLYLLTTDSASPSPTNDLTAAFNQRILKAVDLQPVSPLVVTVYERPIAGTASNLSTTDVALWSDDHQSLDLRYNERLVVVKPQNWMIYTNNGVNFYLLSNNVSNRTAKCDLDRQMVAVDFRLLTLAESDDARDESGQLKVACLNYTLDQLVRLFGSDATKRTYLDLSAYFDKKRNPIAPAVVVDEVIDYLLKHNFL